MKVKKLTEISLQSRNVDLAPYKNPEQLLSEMKSHLLEQEMYPRRPKSVQAKF
jgi:hypothetical protein